MLLTYAIMVARNTALLSNDETVPVTGDCVPGDIVTIEHGAAVEAPNILDRANAPHPDVIAVLEAGERYWAC